MIGKGESSGLIKVEVCSLGPRAFPLWRYSYRGGRGSDGLTAGLALSPGEFTNNSNVTSNLLNLDREEAMGYCQ